MMADNKDLSKGHLIASSGVPIKEAANKKKDAKDLQLCTTAKVDEIIVSFRIEIFTNCHKLYLRI